MTPEGKARVCAAARSYLGTPWLGQGRSKLGVDCTGLVVMSFRDAGFDVNEGPVDYQKVDPKRLMRVLACHCNPLDAAGGPEAADIVVYRLPDAGHVALLVDRAGGGLNAIHSPQFEQVVEARFDPKRGIIKGVYRWAGEG